MCKGHEDRCDESANRLITRCSPSLEGLNLWSQARAEAQEASTPFLGSRMLSAASPCSSRNSASNKMRQACVNKMQALGLCLVNEWAAYGTAQHAYSIRHPVFSVPHLHTSECRLLTGTW